MSNQKISIIAPFYNEGNGISYFYESLISLLNKVSDFEFEVICIDDGSSDNTLEQLIFLSKNDSRFRIIELSRNFGKEAALTAGIDASLGDAIIPIDSDLQDPPELILDLINEWIGGAEVVLARRIDRSSDAFIKRKMAELFYRFHNQLSTIKIPENVGDFRLMDRMVVEALKKLPEHNRFMKGLFTWVGFKTITIDYVRRPRAVGESKFSGWKLWNFALEGFTSFSTAPLKMWSYFGVVGAMCTFFYALFIILKVLLFGVDVPGYASLLLAVLFFGSLQLISLGVLGEYIGRIYMETKNRPIYVIRKQYGVKNES